MVKKKPEEGKDNKEKVLEATVDEIRGRFGDGAIMKLGEAKHVDVDAISTGSISLDLALGVGGLPKGRIIEIFGLESSGKSTLALHAIAQVQKKGGLAAFIDAEHALDPEYAKKLEVKINDLLISQPDTGEQALEILESLVKSGAVDLVVVDSVAALTPRVEIEGEMGQQHIGLQARLLSQACRKLTAITAKSGTTIVFVNQIRIKIGVMFGNPEDTPGGKALKFYSSVRLELRRSAQIKQGDQIIGNRIKAKIVKNKVAPPFRQAEFDIFYNEGISRLADIINTGLKFGVVSRSGAWFNYGSEKLGEGIVATSSDYAIIENSKISESSKIFVSFTSNLAGASWWVCDKTASESFKVCLSEIASSSLSFDYWIVQGKDNSVILSDSEGSQDSETGSGTVPSGASSGEDTPKGTVSSETVFEEPVIIEEPIEEAPVAEEPVSEKLVEETVSEEPVEEEIIEEVVLIEEPVEEVVEEAPIVEEPSVIEETVAEEPVTAIQ